MLLNMLRMRAPSVISSLTHHGNRLQQTLNTTRAFSTPSPAVVRIPKPTAAMRATCIAPSPADVPAVVTIAKPTAAMRATSIVPSLADGFVVVDNRGAKWIRRTDPENGKGFYYNDETWETSDTPPETGILPRPKYSTAWTDDRYPSWAQFLETSSMRKYYYNMSDGTTSWSHPDSPDVDIFVEEHRYINRTLTQVPDTVENAPLTKRLAAFAVDAGIIAAGCSVLGTVFYFELGDPMAAGSGAGFFGWLTLVGRDAIMEKGTRSPGKKLLKLELVQKNGTLPTRWNTMFRSITLPVYLAFTVPELAPFVFGLATLDLGLLMFTPKAMRLGDWMGRTRVIPEQDDRAARMDEKELRDAEADREKPLNLMN